MTHRSLWRVGSICLVLSFAACQEKASDGETKAKSDKSKKDDKGDDDKPKKKKKADDDKADDEKPTKAKLDPGMQEAEDKKAAKKKADDEGEKSAGGGSGDATEIECGFVHTCIKTKEGGAKCWGSDIGSALGYKATDDCAGVKCSQKPQAVPDVKPEDLALGNFATCARLTGGTAKCWGLASGALAGENNIAQIALGEGYGCFRTNDGVAKCWGKGKNGANGDVNEMKKPTAIGALAGKKVSFIAASRHHSCARVSDGTVWCWGDSAHGELGFFLEGWKMNNFDNSYMTSEANQVTGLTGAGYVVLGADHTCAKMADDTVKCWGSKQFGQVGDGVAKGQTGTPTSVKGLTQVAGVVAGARHSCARLASGKAMCWGANDHGQLGDGSGAMHATPVEVEGLTDVKEIAAGTDHTCARLGDGSIKCWGWNKYGQLGDGSTTDRKTPVATSK